MENTDIDDHTDGNGSHSATDGAHSSSAAVRNPNPSANPPAHLQPPTIVDFYFAKMRMVIAQQASANALAVALEIADLERSSRAEADELTSSAMYKMLLHLAQDGTTIANDHKKRAASANDDMNGAKPAKLLKDAPEQLRIVNNHFAQLRLEHPHGLPSTIDYHNASSTHAKRNLGFKVHTNKSFADVAKQVSLFLKLIIPKTEFPHLKETIRMHLALATPTTVFMIACDH